MPTALSLSPYVYLVLGSVLLAASGWVYHWLRMRRFARLNQLGVEMFKSYNHMTLVRSGENIMRTMAATGLLGGCLLLGVGLFKLI